MGEDEQRLAGGDAGEVQYSGGGGVLKEQVHTELTRQGDPPGLRITLDDHGLVVGGAQLRQDARADLAEADQDDVVVQARIRYVVGRCRTEGQGGIHGGGHDER